MPYRNGIYYDPPAMLEGFSSYIDTTLLGASGMGHAEESGVKPLKTKIDLDKILAIIRENAVKSDFPVHALAAEDEAVPVVVGPHGVEPPSGVTNADIPSPASYEGFPVRYPNWNFAGEYEELQGPMGKDKSEKFKGILPLFTKAMVEHEKVAETMKAADDFDKAFEDANRSVLDLISSPPPCGLDWKKFITDRSKEAAPDRLFVVKSPPSYMYFSRRGLMRRDGDKCRFCGKQFDLKKVEGTQPAEGDHEMPVVCRLLSKVRGGTTGFANCVTSCIACMTKKGNQTPEEAGMEVLPPAIPGQAVQHKGNEVWMPDAIAKVNYDAAKLPRNEFYHDPGPAQAFLRELIGDPKNRFVKNQVTIEDDDSTPVVVDTKPKE